MRFKQYLTELSNDYGAGITFFDIDETIFHTKALIYVRKGGKIIKKLTNQEFNTYTLKDDETFSFEEFRSAELFKKTSIPIPKVVERIKRMFRHIKLRGSKVVFLTARADFDDKEVFLSTFSEIGIPITNIYVERAGNLKTGTIAERKQKIIMNYIKDGDYRRVRLVDDDINNLKDFLKIRDNLPQEIINKVKEKYHIPEYEDFPVVSFYALQVINKEGKLKRIYK